jgi:uncharacterized protein
MRKRVTWIVILVAGFVLLGGLTFALEMYFDYLWFQELGKVALFTTSLYAKSLIGSGVLLIAFLFLYFNFTYANRGPGRIEIGIPTPTGQITAYSVSTETVRRLSGVLAALAGLLIGAAEANNWEMVWRWLHRVDFKAVDPVFSRDISFYFFKLPVYNEVVRLGLILSFVALIFALVLYYFKGSLSWRKLRDASGKSRIGLHISLLAALIFLLLAASAYLDRFELLFGDHRVFSGANYADLHARLPMLTLLAIAALAGALIWIFNAFASTNRAAMLAVLLYFAVFLVGNVYPALVQKISVTPNELNKESPQIKYNIDATLRAYGLDKIEERDLSDDKSLTTQDIKNNSATIHSIRLWDHGQLLDALRQIQEIRNYYDFVAVDNDRYFFNGELQQIMLSARELNSERLPERNWINEHLSYTHGYGLALGPVNRMTSEGLPVLEVQNIPPVSEQPSFKITRPEIYYGELTRGYALAKTGQKEFDYPGKEDVYATYQGTGGVPVNSFFRKLLFALYFKDPNIVLSSLVTPESRFLYYREVKERLGRLAPFLKLDPDPYMVISEGRLFWIQDGYTISNRYPYSKTMMGNGGNYIRNSVKMVMDAYNGKVDMYVSDPGDPLIQVYQNIFPGVFRPLTEIPDDLRRHLRYPETIFQVQANIYAEYHMRTPQTFYQKEDLWKIPAIDGGGNENAMAPYYMIMRLPQEKQEEFILMLPFTPRDKGNLSAWMAARSDGENYGRLVVYRFSKQSNVYGPQQIVSKINQDTLISPQISLWNQRGSQVNQGNLLIIPIEEALLYIRPLYLRSESDKMIPELKRVIVAYKDKIVMEESLEAAIDKIFGGELPAMQPATPGQTKPGAAEAAVPAGKNQLQQAGETYDRMIQAQRQGDWAKYGDELKKLGALLEELKRTRDAQQNKKP